MIQKCLTSQYLTEDGEWVDSPAEALDFQNGSKAIKYAVENELDDVQIVLKFDRAEYDVRTPLKKSRNRQRDGDGD